MGARALRVVARASGKGAVVQGASWGVAAAAGQAAAACDQVAFLVPLARLL